MAFNCAFLESAVAFKAAVFPLFVRLLTCCGTEFTQPILYQEKTIFKVFIGGSCWFFVVLDGFWWFFVVHGGSWWFLVFLGDSWWFFAVLGGSR